MQWSSQNVAYCEIDLSVALGHSVRLVRILPTACIRLSVPANVVAVCCFATWNIRRKILSSQHRSGKVFEVPPAKLDSWCFAVDVRKTQRARKILSAFSLRERTSERARERLGNTKNNFDRKVFPHIFLLIRFYVSVRVVRSGQLCVFSEEKWKIYKKLSSLKPNLWENSSLLQLNF